MKRKLEIVFAFFLLASFFMPWNKSMDMISSTPLNGFYYLFISLLFGSMGSMRGNLYSFLLLLTGCALVIIFWLGYTILLKSGKDTFKSRRLLFFLTFGAFLFQITDAVIAGMQHGKMFMVSLSYQFSFVCYGVYVALITAAGLFLLGKKGSR